MANEIRYKVGFDIDKTGLNQLKSSLQDLQKMSLSEIMRVNNTDLSSARMIFKDISSSARTVEKALDEAFNTKLNTVNIETFNEKLKASGININQVYQNFSKAGAAGEAAFRRLTTSLTTTNLQLKETHKVLDKMATTLVNTVKWNAASTAVNGISRAAQQAWGYIKALDTSLNNIRVVTGKSSEEMANFAIQANEAAKSLGRTTVDYTKAALIYAQQGLNDAEIQERTNVTLKVANITGQSADEVSEQLTAV